MSKKRLLLITFDYELFLGTRSGSLQQCLIRPTAKLLACLDKNAFKAIFFVDTLYILRMRALAAEHRLVKTDLEAITNQLVQIVNSGHEIHPHIHAHWTDATYDPAINEWCLSNKRYYTFASLPAEQQTELFDKSVGLIRSILELAKRSQSVDTYRAGGWSIQPFESFRPHFQKHGIKHEFSVIPGRYFGSDAHQFDFRAAPADRPVYHFDQDICSKNDEGGFTEWTISSLSMTKRQQWFDFKVSGVLKRLHITGGMGGIAVKTNILEEGDLYSNGKLSRQVASFEGLNPYRVLRYRHMIKKLDYFHFISHPKLLHGFELKMIAILLRSLRKDPLLETDFRKQEQYD